MPSFFGAVDPGGNDSRFAGYDTFAAVRLAKLKRVLHFELRGAPLQSPYRLVGQLNRFSIQHPVLVISIWLAASALAIVSLGQLQVNPTTSAWLKKSDTRLDRLKDLRSNFDSGRNLVVMASARTGNIFTVDGLTALRKIHQGLEQIEGTIRVDSVVSFPYSHAQGDALMVDELLGREGALTSSFISRVRSRVLKDKRLVGRLVTTSADSAIVVATFVPGIDGDIESARTASTEAQALIDRLGAEYPDLEFLLSGSVPGMSAYADAAAHDASVLLPLALFAALTVMLCYLRFESGSWRTAVISVLAVLVLIVCSVSLPLGVMPVLGLQATNVTVVIPVAILTLAVADCLHVLVTFYQHRRSATDQVAALLSSLGLNAEAIWITSMTTLLGFLTLNVSWALPYIIMGNLVALGVFLAWVATNSLFPAMLSLTSLPVSACGGTEGAMRRLAYGVIRRRHAILIASVASVAVVLVGVPKNQMNDAWLEYLTPDTPFGHDTHQMMARIGGISAYEFVLDSGVENGVYEPAFLTIVDAFSIWLEDQPEVAYVQGLHDTLKRLNANLHGDDPSYLRLPDERGEAAQYLLLYELSLPYGASLTNEVNLDKSALRLVAGMYGSNTQDILELQQRALNWFDHHAPALKSAGSGDSIVIAELSRQLTTSMIANTVMVLLAITIMIGLVFRSLGYAVLCLIVNSLPILVALGIWGLLVGDMGMSSALVFSMTIGIIVDYSVHFLSKYRVALHGHAKSAGEALVYGFSTVGVALLVTTAVLGLNFGLLSLSDHKLNIFMGALISMTIVLALLSQLFVLPVLLLLSAHRRGAAGQAAVS